MLELATGSVRAGASLVEFAHHHCGGKGGKARWSIISLRQRNSGGCSETGGKCVGQGNRRVDGGKIVGVDGALIKAVDVRLEPPLAVCEDERVLPPDARQGRCPFCYHTRKHHHAAKL